MKYIFEIFNKNQWPEILILMCIKVYEQQINNAGTLISQNYTQFTHHTETITFSTISKFQVLSNE